MNRHASIKALIGPILLVSLALTGCSASSPLGVEESYEEEYGYVEDPGYTEPGTEYSGEVPPSTWTEPGTVAAPGYDVNAQLSVSVVNIKNGSFLGNGACVATVEVTNPSQVRLTGMLTVTFTDGGEPVESEPQTRQVTLEPGETQTFTFEDAKWSTDSAIAVITTDAPAYNVPSGGGYGY